MKKKTLKIAVIVLSLLALVAVSVPFLSSLGPTNRALENARQSGKFVDVGKLAPGTFVEKGSKYSRYFALRDFDGQVRVFSIPYGRGTYWVAEFRWDRPVIPCSNFGPVAIGNNLIKGGAFRCHDSERSDWSKRELAWDYSGNNLGDQTEDMAEARYEIEGDTLFLRYEVVPLTDIARANAE